MITIYLNGQPLNIAADATMSTLIEVSALSGKRIAVERNGEIVPRSRYALTSLAADDRIEIVVAVGGG